MQHSDTNKLKNLIIIRAGDKSLHTEWFGQNQNFDLVVSYFGDDPTIYKDTSPRFDCKGSKWEGLHNLLTSNQINWKNYDYIWIPDDDLRTDCNTINKFFDIVNNLNSILSQPTLDDKSFYSWPTTKQNTRFKLRKVNCVEIMAPCFRVDFLEKCLPTLEESTSGHGLDLLWGSMVDHSIENVYMIDEVTITHTRPVGSANCGLPLDGGSAKKRTRNDFNNIIEKYSLSTELTNIYGIDYNNNKHML
jgi:hypothetical protein